MRAIIKQIPGVIVVVSGTVLILASLTKLTNFSMFVDLLHEIPYLPGWSILPLAQVVTLAEFTVGASLIAPPLRNLAMKLSVPLIACFFIYNSLRIFLHLRAPCPCMPGLFQIDPVSGLSLNAVILSATVFEIRYRTASKYAPLSAL